MAQLTPIQVTVLAEAMDRRSRNESLEQAVGRAMRRAGLEYEEYIAVMDAIRYMARRRKVEQIEAARLLMQR